jgi:hypothetical protein
MSAFSNFRHEGFLDKVAAAKDLQRQGKATDEIKIITDGPTRQFASNISNKTTPRRIDSTCTK